MSDDKRLLSMTAALAKAYVSGNMIPPDALPGVIKELHQSLVGLSNPAARVVQEPAVSVRQSIKHDRIICLECGKGGKMLKRRWCHVWTALSMQGVSMDDDRCGKRSCVRPLSAVRMTAGPDEVRGPGPSQSTGVGRKNRNPLSRSAFINMMQTAKHWVRDNTFVVVIG